LTQEDKPLEVYSINGMDPKRDIMHINFGKHKFAMNHEEAMRMSVYSPNNIPYFEELFNILKHDREVVNQMIQIREEAGSHDTRFVEICDDIINLILSRD
jgi:hypothetical protein